MRISQELSCQGNVNVQNTEARNVFTERSEHGPLRLVTAEDACDVLGEQEAPLRVPAGFEILSCAPSTEQLDSSKAESDALLGKVLMVRFEHYGWCKGTITGKVVDRRRTINKEAINFIAEFDIDAAVAAHNQFCGSTDGSELPKQLVDLPDDVLAVVLARVPFRSPESLVPPGFYWNPLAAAQLPTH